MNLKPARLYVSDCVAEQMKKIPTVDIDRPTRSQFKRMAAQLGHEPVVHCKDCVHRDPEDKKCDCGCWHTPFTTEDDDFCSYGERKNDFVDDNKIGERRPNEQ